MENIWQENKDQLIPLLQSANCEDGICTLGATSVSYQRNDAGCGLVMDSKDLDLKAQFGVVEGAHIFSMEKPGATLYGETDYNNYIKADWKSVNYKLVFEKDEIDLKEVTDRGSLKVERVEGSDGKENFKIELVRAEGDEETRFFADCSIGENEAVCETRKGDISDWLLSNKVQIRMEKQIDTDTQEETVKFTVQTHPLFGLMPAVQLGEFEAKFNPNGEIIAQGNVQLPNSKEPLFAGKLHCKDPEHKSCSGEYTMKMDSGTEANQHVAQNTIRFESTPRSYDFSSSSKTEHSRDAYYNRQNMEQSWKFAISEDEKKVSFTTDHIDTVDSSFRNSHSHITTNTQVEKGLTGLKVDHITQDVSNPDEKKTLLSGAYQYDSLSPIADTHRADIRLANGFEVEAKVRIPK